MSVDGSGALVCYPWQALRGKTMAAYASGSSWTDRLPVFSSSRTRFHGVRADSDLVSPGASPLPSDSAGRQPYRCYLRLIRAIKNLASNASRAVN